MGVTPPCASPGDSSDTDSFDDDAYRPGSESSSSDTSSSSECSEILETKYPDIETEDIETEDQAPLWAGKPRVGVNGDEVHVPICVDDADQKDVERRLLGTSSPRRCAPTHPSLALLFILSQGAHPWPSCWQVFKQADHGLPETTREDDEPSSLCCKELGVGIMAVYFDIFSRNS